MKSFIRVFISLNLILLFLSCSNLIQRKGSDIAFKLGDEAVSKISKTLENSVSESSIVKLECEFRGIDLKSQSIEIKLSELKTATMVLSDIPYDKEFNILLKIYFNSTVIYQGESNKITLNKKNNGKHVNINISEKRGSYKLNYNGAENIPVDFSENTQKEYYINSPDITLPTDLKKTGYTFLGWYANLNTPSELQVKTLGQSNYLGSVSLEAKWIYSSEIYEGDYRTGPIVIKPGNRKLTLYWENTKDNNFDHVNIYRQTSLENKTLEKLAQVSGIPGEVSSYEVTGLTNYTENLFVIKTVNKAGEESNGCKTVSGTSYESVPESVKHNTVEKLAAGTSGTYNQTGEYVLFGDYPQSVATEAELASINKDKVYLFNSMPCYSDNNGNYYVELDAWPLGKDRGSKGTFKNGVDIQEISYYFKIEPIKWRVLSHNYVDSSGVDKGCLLLAEDVLLGKEFSMGRRNYEESTIRGFLNSEIITKDVDIENPDWMLNPDWEHPENRFIKVEHKEVFKSSGFANWSFSEQTISDIIQNVKVSTSPEKVFLLSMAELTNVYGFPEAIKKEGSGEAVVSSRQRVPTDYARALGAFIVKDKPYETDWWWTRDLQPDSYGYNVPAAMGCEGNINVFDTFTNGSGGVVPAIVVSPTSLSSN